MIKISSNVNKSTFNNTVRPLFKTTGVRDILRFTNFKRQLSASNDNVLPSSKTNTRLISRYFFSQKKTYTNKYKAYNVSILINKHSFRSVDFLRRNPSLVLGNNKHGLHQSSKYSLNRFISTQGVVILNQVQIFLNRYTTLKSSPNLKLCKPDNRRSMTIVKSLSRLSYRQYRYVKIFWNKIKNLLTKKYTTSKKKLFFKRKKILKKNTATVFNNTFSLYPFIFHLGIPTKFNNVVIRYELNSPKSFVKMFNFDHNFLDEVGSSDFLEKIKLFKNTNTALKSKLLSYSFPKTFIFSKHESSFILFHNGIIFPYRFRFKFNVKQSYRVKKIFYSFLRPNELKKSILDSRKKLIYNKTVTLLKSSKSIFKKLVFTHKNVLSLLRNSVTDRVTHATLNSIDTISSYPKSFLLNTGNTLSNELRVPRVRFKPGYQRLWRNFRLAFSESVNFKYVYQQQLTKYLMRFYRKLNQVHFDFHESDVKKTLIYSRLVPDLHTFDIFFSNKLIFMNGTVLTNRDIQVYNNDFIQLEISNWYYIFSRWLVTTTLKRNSRFKSLVFRKSLAGRYKVMKQVKQRSNYTPKWINTAKYDLSDIKTFLEVDFLTLSLFYIYNTNLFLYYTPSDIRVTRYNLFRLYNWKYIT